MMEIFQGTKSRFCKNQSSSPTISETEEIGNRNPSSSALVNTNATNCSQQENQKGCVMLKGDCTCSTNCWCPRQLRLSVVHLAKGSCKAHVGDTAGQCPGHALQPSTYGPHRRRLSCSVHEALDVPALLGCSWMRGALRGPEEAEPGEDERLGSLRCRAVTACSRHAGRGRERGHGTAGCTASPLQRPTHRGWAPRRAAGRAKRRGMRMEASGCKRRADHQGNTKNSQQRQGETFGKNLQMQRLEFKGFSASSRIALGFPGSAGTKRAPALFLGGSTCSNKTLFFSRVNVATAGCLGSLPGKKNKRSYRSKQMQRPNAEFSICEPDQREYHTCCDLQGKHVRGCNAPLIQVFQTKSPQFPNHHLWLRAS